ncbi:MAG TPA: tRNA (guanosine(37)-N1)-methyltransferase TrmD [bacterium]|nr:tRNA (guanosine(37)-N1)-methyltransferase TrmD [bacterium]
MRIDVLTIFPKVFTPLNASMMKRGREKGCVSFHLWNLRDFSTNAYRQVDDAPFGGGRGMVLKCEPIYRGVEEIRKYNPEGTVILTTPQGRLLTQEIAAQLAQKPGLILICGHYEGVDERVSRLCDEELSIGDYILTGGELPAMVIIDAVVRLIPGVLPEGAAERDSFCEGLLDWPCYTRPAEFRGMKVPEVLLSGNHKAVEEWRRLQAEERTRKRRPDLYQKYLEKKKAVNTQP